MKRIVIFVRLKYIIMNYSKTILCATVLAITTLFSACQKNQKTDTTYSADLDLSFETTDEFKQLVTRQFEVSLNGQTYGTTRIEGTSFSKTVTLPNISAPANIDVKVVATFSVAELPDSTKYKNSYKIKCTVGGTFVTATESSPQGTIYREDYSDFLEFMNYTVHFKLNENGTLSKSVD